MANFATSYVNKSGYYDRKCATCTHYQLDNIKTAYNDGFVCDIHFLHRTALDDSCPKYSKANRKDKDIKKAFEKLTDKYGSYRPHKYYITTAICNLIGYENTFHKEIGLFYRAEFLEGHAPNFISEYDIYGPIIAQNLIDNNDIEYAKELFDNYLINFFNAVLNKQYENALIIFTDLYDTLKKKYLGNARVRKNEE